MGVPASGVAGLGNISAFANISVANSNTNWWLDVDRDFCVMKYPAKDNGSNVAVSITAGTPWVSTTRDSSLNTCAALGADYRLISNTQWQTVTRNAESAAANWSGNAVGSGMMARGHTDNLPSNALASSTDDNPCFGTENSGAAWNTPGATPAAGSEQKRTQTLSNGEVVWVFSGNVWQWMSDNYADLGLTPAIARGNWDEFSNTANFPTVPPAINRQLFAPLCLYSTAQNIGMIYGGSAGAVLRGGDWVNGALTGLFSAFLDQTPTIVGPRIGFRCAYLP